jgi:ADP-heptose:LPS heptosyltransferase
LEGFRDVDGIIGLDRARFRRFSLTSTLREGFRVLRMLRREKFAVAIDFQGYGETALLTWCTGAAMRWGITRSRVRKHAYTHVMPRDNSIHPADCNLKLLQKAGIQPSCIRNEFGIPATALDEARRFCLERGLQPQHRTLLLQPFTSSFEKNWPLEKYLAVARYWKERGVQVLFSGGPADREALAPVREAGFQISAGVPLLTSAGLASLSVVVIGGDTGLLHLAVAMGKRVLMIMQSNAPGSTHPFEHKDWTVLPRSGESISSITVASVNADCAQALADLGFHDLGTDVKPH